MPPNIPVRRSKLIFSPLDRDATRAALSSEADALVIDLRAGRRSKATREAAAQLLAEAASQPLDFMLLLGDDPASDLKACLVPAVSGVVVRARSASDAALVAEVLDQAEAGGERRVGMDIALASCDAVFDCLELAAAARGRVTSLSMWEEALLAEMGMPEPHEVDLLFYARGRTSVAARLVGSEAHAMPFMPAVDGKTPSVEARALLARNMGFHGTFCWRPEDAGAINRGLTAPEPEVSEARGMKEAMDEGIRQGLGAVTYKGMMVDIAMYKQCRVIIDRADAIARRESVRTGRD
jgi:citrate lyase subunit beta/citryl-CoA lyase